MLGNQTPYTCILVNFTSRSPVLSTYTYTCMKRSLICVYVQELCQMHCLGQNFSIHPLRQRVYDLIQPILVVIYPTTVVHIFATKATRAHRD